MSELAQKKYNRQSLGEFGTYADSNTPKISIIIPVYNVERYIEKALDSVVNQTFKDIEIIVVNDCSPDNSMEIVERYAQNDDRFVIINQETNQGQGVARNRALDIARGEYIMFLDPDDWYELDACEKAYSQISANQNEIVFFNLYSIKEHNGKLGTRKINTSRLKPFAEVIGNPHINLRELKTNWILGGWTVVQIYSREFLNNFQIRYTGHRYAEDLSFIIKAMICSKNISILDEPLYNYRKRDSFSTIYTDCYEDIIETKKEAYEILCKFNADKEILNKFLLYEIGSNNTHLKKFAKANKDIRNVFYLKIKYRFEEIKKISSEEVLKNSPAYNDFKLILRCKNFREYQFKRILRKVIGC